MKQVLTVPNIAMSLNEYRNANYHVLNEAKKDWCAEIAQLVFVQGIRPVTFPVSITYIFHFQDKRARDADNCIVTAKFSHDALVECGILQGDTFDHVEQVCILRGDNVKPKFVEIHIEPMNRGD